jgi:leucyl-tRNA synthetase
MSQYSPKEIEPKWQKIWDETGTYTADLKSDKPKYIAMSMFNYPSGAGIHIGHAMNYTISDVKARFKRQQGYESYHPVGWDAFGLPAENYAIKAGVSPQESMATIIPDYHKQYKAMGWSNDWEKEIATHRPEYYKWSQWIFSEMYRKGLAYQEARLQWWCTKCQTVLANEQIIDGKCWRHDSADDPIVEKKEVKQWFFKITEYADELLEAINDLDWTDSVKLAQKNWIGRSEGAEILFAVKESEDKITVFTTRADTIFGATFMLLAPEHELVTRITTSEQKEPVQEYVQQAQKKTELERQASKEKTGVFTGAYAINPANGEELPIWVADYVLADYGTGAVMAVPAHDERDNEFAVKYNLQIVQVIDSGNATEEVHSGEGKLINSGAFESQDSYHARKNIIAELAQQEKAELKTNYKMRDWSVSRQRYWGAPIPIVNCESCGTVLVPDKDLPVILPELDDFQPSGDGRSALARATDWLKVSCPECGGAAERETDTLDTYICSSWYMLRYFDPHNQQQIFDSDIVKKWEPIDFYNGADHATAHLLYARFVARFFTKQGLINNPEPFKQFLFNGKVMASDGTMFSKSKGNGVDPLEIIEQGYGADALRTYLMFAAPLEIWAKWDEQGVPGTYRFLARLWGLIDEYLEAEQGEISDETTKELQRSSHKMVKKVTEDIEENRYNTAIAALMTNVNELYKLKAKQLAACDEWKTALENIVQCTAPFAPHITEELWQKLGHSDSVHVDHWPLFDETKIAQDTITIVVQVNGKVRANVDVAASADKEAVISAAKQDDNVRKHLNESDVKKEIYVPGRLVNFVV